MIEFWVMRVLLHQGHRVTFNNMTPAAHVATLALVNTGDLALLPDGSIAEPVEVFTKELDAQAHREQLIRDDPSQDYRVILNTDVTD